MIIKSKQSFTPVNVGASTGKGLKSELVIDTGGMLAVKDSCKGMIKSDCPSLARLGNVRLMLNDLRGLSSMGYSHRARSSSVMATHWLSRSQTRR